IVHRDLGDTLGLTGGQADSNELSDGDNIGVVANASDGLDIKLSKNLSELDSVTTGDPLSEHSVLDKDGLTVDDGAKHTQVGAGVIKVTGSESTITMDGDAGTITGLTNKTFDPNDFTSGQAATEDQLNAVYDIANAGWTVADADGNSNNIGPKGKVTFEGDDNVSVTESGDDDDANVQVELNDDIN